MILHVYVITFRDISYKIWWKSRVALEFYRTLNSYIHDSRDLQPLKVCIWEQIWAVDLKFITLGPNLELRWTNIEYYLKLNFAEIDQGVQVLQNYEFFIQSQLWEMKV